MLVDEGYFGTSDEDSDSDDDYPFAEPPPSRHDFCHLSFGRRATELCECVDEGFENMHKKITFQLFHIQFPL